MSLSNMNVCIFIGNTTRDPEMKSVGSNEDSGGEPNFVTTSSLAVNRSRPDGIGPDGKKQYAKEVMFIDFEAWGTTGRMINNMVPKGAKIALRGRLKQNVWTTDEGQNRQKHVLVVERITLLDDKSKSDNNNSTGDTSFNKEEYENHNENEVEF